MSKAKVETSNKLVQTTIHCFPHVLLTENDLVKVSCDRSSQTAATTTPSTENLHLYALLEFLPYQVIAEGAIKELDLPRRALLQWKLPTLYESDSATSSFDTGKTPEREESEINPQRGVLKKSNSGSRSIISISRYVAHHHYTMQKSVNEQEVQTVLTVVPHVLDTDEVANVYTELSIQTSITCLPNESISNILPQLKANLSHASGRSVKSRTQSISWISSVEIDTEIATDAELENVDAQPDTSSQDMEIAEVQTDTNGEEIEQQTDENGDEVEQQTDNNEDAIEQQTDKNGEDAEDPESLEGSNAVTVTLSATQATSRHGCQCGTQLINAIASKMRVQASTLKLTPKVFPPNVKFEDRMMEVLNTTVAILQTEMAKLMELYADDAIGPCGGSGSSPKQQEVDEKVEDSQQEAIKDDFRSCNCGATKEAQNIDRNMVDVQNKYGDQDVISPNLHKIITEISTTRQVIDRNTLKPTLIKEDVVEETTRRILLNDNNEQVVEERILRKSTFRENQPNPSPTQPLMIQAEPKEMQLLNCACGAVVEDDTTTKGNVQSGENITEATPPIEDTGIDELTEDITETITDEISPIMEDADETVPDVNETSAEVTQNDEESLLDNDSAATEDVAPTNEIRQSDLLGDYRENKRISYIPCECHPTEAGAAPPSLFLNLPLQTVDEAVPLDPAQQSQSGVLDDSEEKSLNFKPCVYQSTNAGAASPTLSTPANENNESVAPSSDKTIKFEFLLNKSMKDVESVSAASAIVIRATISSPDMRKRHKENVQIRPSLPDLREQVIRLSVIYKNGATEPEIRTEELLTPGCAIQIKPYKLPSLRFDKRPLSCSLCPSGPTNIQTIPNNTCECNKLASSPRLHLTLESSFKIDSTTTKKDNASCCFDKPVRKSSIPYSVSFNKLATQTEEVDFSMPCPSRPPTKTTGCDASCDYVSRRNSRTPPLPAPTSCIHLKKQPTCIPSCSPSQQPPPPRPCVPPPLPSTSVTYPNKPKKSEVEIVIAVSVTDKSEESSTGKTLSFTYEDDTAYEEPYMEMLSEDDTSTGVQTDLTLGDKLESESLSSVLKEDDMGEICSSKTEMPWGKISLPSPGSYSIKPVKKEEPEPCNLETCNANGNDGGEAEAAKTEEGEVEGNEAQGGEAQGGEAQGGEAEGSVAEGSVTEGNVAEGSVADGSVAEENEAEGGEAEGGEAEGGDAEEGEVEGSETGGEAVETEGDNESDVTDGEEKEPPPPAEPAKAEPDECKPKQKLLFEDTVYKHNEPYMEGLYKVFPNSDDEDCGSRTEMPWKDIILPQNCKIRKMKKSKKCLCRSCSKNMSGMFIPSNLPPNKLEEDDDDILELHIGIDEPPSGIFSVAGGAVESKQTVSVCSTVSNIHQTKRSPKEYAFLLDLGKDSNYSISFKAGRQTAKQVSAGVAIHPNESQPFEVSRKQKTEAKTSSLIISIKPSTECPYESETIAVFRGKDSRGLNSSANSMYLGSVPAESRSYTSTNISRMADKNIKNTNSMPSIPSQKSVKATVSLKRLGEPDKSISNQMTLTPGGNSMTLKIPDESCSVNLKFSTQDSTSRRVTGSSWKNQQPLESSSPCDCQDKPKTETAKEEEVFTPATCSCKDKVKLDTFKQDPVMAALEAYEAEMKPLRRALTELQQKIRNLNMPEMKGCMCTTALNNSQQQQPQPSGSLGSTTIRNKIQLGTDTGAVTKTSVRITPSFGPSSPYYGGPTTCTYFQPAAFRAPVVQPLPYGYLPPPMLPPYRQSYPPSPNYMPSNRSRHDSSCYCNPEANNMGYEAHYLSHKDSGYSRRDNDYGSCRARCSSHHKEDISMQARYFGVYPDYRGRTYADEHAAYDSRSNRHGRDSNRRKYRVENLISLHSNGDLTDNDSPGTSDEGQYYLESRPRRSSRHGEQKCSRSSNFDVGPPCKDSFDGYRVRPGQALKTDPDQFLVSNQSNARRPHGTTTYPKIISKNKIHVKVPYR